ncbi:Lrp/AsnC family transcriptional regulator [Lonepinella sp. MS14435]|uniref:Lrp/AsnC family transcriptional regulator n=1 Tax=Lonepinella sp. MS14435 TaxID=3003618 RepID=UPI0036DBAB8D
MPTKILDNTDLRILRALQQNGKQQNNELAETIGLSSSACLRRVNLLEQSGVIDKYVCLLNPKKLNLNVTIYILGSFIEEDLKLKERFIFEMRLIPQITECHFMAGDYDFILKIQTHDLDEFYSLQKQYLTTSLGIKNLKTEIILQTVKNTTELPLSPYYQK